MNFIFYKDDMVLDIDYDYQPKEEATLEYPGCDEDICINGAFVNGINIFKSLSESTKNKICDQILEIVSDE